MLWKYISTKTNIVCIWFSSFVNSTSHSSHDYCCKAKRCRHVDSRNHDVFLLLWPDKMNRIMMTATRRKWHSYQLHLDTHLISAWYNWRKLKCCESSVGAPTTSSPSRGAYQGKHVLDALRGIWKRSVFANPQEWNAALYNNIDPGDLSRRIEMCALESKALTWTRTRWAERIMLCGRRRVQM